MLSLDILTSSKSNLDFDIFFSYQTLGHDQVLQMP